MLTMLRSKSRLIMMLFIVPLCVVFVLFFGYSGISAQRQSEHDTIVKINDVSIHRDQFIFIRGLYQQQAQDNRQALDADKLDSLAWDDVVHNELVRQAALELGVEVTEAEIAQQVRPMFMGEDGQFNQAAYEWWYRSNFQSSQQFYYLYQNVVRQQKMNDLIRSMVKVSELDLWEDYERQNSFREIEWIEWDVADWLDEIEINSDAVAAYYEKHQERYRLPDQIKVFYTEAVPSKMRPFTELTETQIERYFRENRMNYMVSPRAYLDFVTVSADDYLAEAQAMVTGASVEAHYNTYHESFVLPERKRVRFAKLEFEALAEEVGITDASIEEHYEQNRDRLMEPPQVWAYRLLLEVPVGATPETRQSLLTELSGLVDGVTDVEAFQAIAREHSQEPIAAKGGDLGWFKRGTYYFELEDRAFATKPGEMSEPFVTRDGAQVVFVRDMHPERKKTLDEAREEIVETLQTRLARELARKKMETLATKLDAKSLSAEVVDATAWNITETGWVNTQHETIAEFGDDTRMAAWTIGNLEVGEMSEPMQGAQAMYLLEVIDATDSRPMTLTEARPVILTDLSQEIANNRAYDLAYEFGAEIRGSTAPFGEVASVFNLSATASEPIFENIGNVEGIGGVARTWGGEMLEREVGHIGGPERMEKGWVVYRINRKTDEYLPELYEVYGRVRQDALAHESARLAQRLLERIEAQLDMPNTDQLPLAAAALLEEASAALTLMAAGETVDNWTENEAEAMLLVTAEYSDWFKQGEAPEGKFWSQTVMNFVDGLTRLNEPPTTLVFDTMGQQQPGQAPRTRGIYQFELTERRSTHIPELDDVREKVTNDWKHEQAGILARQAAESALRDLNDHITAHPLSSATRVVELDVWAELSGHVYREPQMIQRDGYLGRLGMAQSVARTAFQMQPGQVSGVVSAGQMQEFGSEMVEVPDYYLIFQVVNAEDAQPAMFADERGDIRQRLVGGLFNPTLSRWIDHLKQQSVIVPSPGWEHMMDKDLLAADDYDS